MADICPTCGSPLGEVQETKSGKQLQRCSAGRWNPETKKNEGCDYVKWLVPEPETLDEKCPKCGSPLIMMVTRFGKKMKKCSTAGWDSKNRIATGCTYVEWLKPGYAKQDSGGEEFLPPEPPDLPKE